MIDIRAMNKTNSRPVVNRSQPPIQVADRIHTPVSLFVSWGLGEGNIGPFLDKEYRDAYLDGYVTGSIAHQIRALREKSGLNQKQFGDEIGKPQSVVSRLEDTEYGGITVNTLLDIAKARNVGLKVEFTDYVSLLRSDVSPRAMNVDTIHETYQKCLDGISFAPIATPNVVFVLVNPSVSVTISGRGSPSVIANTISGAVSSW